MYKLVLSSILLIGVVHLAASQPPRFVFDDIAEKLERARELSVELKQHRSLQYPFHDAEFIGMQPDLLQVSEKILFIYQYCHGDFVKFAEILKDIHKLHRKHTLRYPYAIQNYYGFQNSEPHLDADLLFASFVVADQEGLIFDIELFLRYVCVYFGSAETAGGFSFGNKSFETEAKHVSEEDQIKHWPAANAILSNPEQSIPLLIEAVKNPELEELLRLRAAAFLHQMAPKELEAALSEVSGEIALQMICIQVENVSWKHIRPNLCESIELGKRRQARVLQRRLQQ